MKGLDTGKDKVKKICDVLRKETLEPAKLEAEEILENARLAAERMMLEAEKAIEKMQEEAQLEIEKQRNIFQSSLYQACRQALDALKQNIEEKLFNRELFQLLSKHVQDARVLAQLITAIVKAVEKEGLDADLSVLIPASVPARDVNALLLKDVLDKLKEKSVLVGPLTGGIEVKLRKENLIIDFSDIALKELVAGYIRKDFREILFGIT